MINTITPLHFDIINSDVKAVEQLLEKGASVDVTDRIGRTPLFYAIEYADVKLSEILSLSRANVKDNLESSIDTVMKDRVEVVEVLLNYVVDINTIDNSGRTALHFTVLNEMPDYRVHNSVEDPIITVKAEIVKLLLSKGANVNAQTDSGLTALHVAAEKGFLKVVEVLLQYGADTNVCDMKGRTALHYTIFNEMTDYHVNRSVDDPIINVKAEIAKLLLNKGAHVNAKTEDGLTALHLATQIRYQKVIETLLQYNADINASDKYGKTALHFTALCGTINSPLYKFTHDTEINITGEIAKLLLSNGANVNAKTKKSKTTLHFAALNGYIKVIEALFQYNVDINARDENGRTALHFTALSNLIKYSCLVLSVEDHYIKIKTKILRLLLSKGANANAQTCAGFTTLHFATKEKFLQIVETLLEYDADINICDRNGIAALHCTSEKEGKGPLSDKVCSLEENMDKLLLSNGANVDAKTKNGETALHIASGYGYTKIVECLLKYNANVNCKSSDGTTPLHAAAESGFQEIINILLKFGADVNSADDRGRTALYIASALDHLKITVVLPASEESYHRVVTTLLDHGAKFNFICMHNKIYLAPGSGDSNLNVNIRMPSYLANYLHFNCFLEYYLMDEKTFNIYKRELIRLEAANLYVSKRNLELLRCHNMTDYKKKCEKEIASMKCEKIDNSNVSFYDILVKDTTLLAKYMRNENIVQVLKSKKYEKKFPEYAEKIACNFEKAMYRSELQEKGIEIFNIFFNTPELPHNCVEKIVNYLNNKDIRVLLHQIRRFDGVSREAVVFQNC